MNAYRTIPARITSRLLPALLAALLVAACGGGGASVLDDTGGASTIVFPPGAAMTTEASLDVRGATGGAADVVSVLVAGKAATTTDGFATWTAEIDLVEGDNDIDVVVDRGVGGRTEATVVVRHEGPIPHFPYDAAYDRTTNVIYSVDRASAVVSIHVGTGVRSLIAEGVPAKGVAVDETTGLVYMTAVEPPALRVVVLDPSTGTQTVLSENDDGKGPNLSAQGSSSLYPVAVDPVAGLALIVDDHGAGTRLFAVDLVTGTRSILAELDNASGSKFQDVEALPGSGRVYLLDSGVDTIWAVDLTSGQLTVEADGLEDVRTPSQFTLDPARQRAFYRVYPNLYEVSFTTNVSLPFLRPDDVPAGSAYLSARGLWVDAPGERLIAFGGNPLGVDAIDFATKSPSRLHGTDVGTGVIDSPGGLCLLDAGHLAFSDESLQAVVAIDLADGSRQVITGDGVGTGLEFDAPVGVARAVAPGTVYVVSVDPSPNMVHAVDVETGARRVVSDETLGLGPDLEYGIDMDRAADGRLYIVDEDGEQVIRVDPVSGDREQVAGDSVGTGPAVDSANGLDYDDASSRLYVTTSEGILRVDPGTGDRILFLAQSSVSSAELADLVVSPDGDVMHVVDRNGSVHRVDVATKAVHEILHVPYGSTGPLRTPAGLVALYPQGVLFLADRSYDGVFAVDSVTGASVLIAR